jgi:hypothetical protein
MRWPRRREFLFALAGAALFSTPGGLRGTRLEPATVSAREWATVGRVVSRRVDGRTIVLIPVSGPVRPRLSEPFRVGSRWRLYLTLEGARIGINARPRKGEGVLDLSVTETGSDVRIAIDVKELASYGTKPAEEGILVWIEDDATAAHRAEEQAQALPIIGDGPRLASAEAPPPAPEPEGRGWIPFTLLLAAAAGLGFGFRWWRAKGTMPHWVESAGKMFRAAFVQALRGKVLVTSTETDETSETNEPAQGMEPETNELRKTG